MKDLITFLNSQEPTIGSFDAIHVGFFESDKGMSFYVTGAQNGEPGSDEHCLNEPFPLAPNRYWSMESEETDPFIFLEKVKQSIETALNEGVLAEPYKKAKILSLGWDDGDIEFIKGDSSASV